MRIDNELKILESIKFNFGAFILAPFWLYYYDKRVLALCSLFCTLVPYIFQFPFFIKIVLYIISLVIPVYCGIKGDEIALTSNKHNSVSAMKTAQVKWLKAGVYCFIFIMIFGRFFIQTSIISSFHDALAAIIYGY